MAGPNDIVGELDSTANNIIGEVGSIVAPGEPSPQAEPVINLKPAVVGGVDQLPLRDRFEQQVYFANDPVATEQFLAKKGFQAPPGGYSGGSIFGGGGLGELGRTATDLVAGIPRMVAMGAGATAGAAGGIASGPGMIGTSAVGGALGSMGLSEFGQWKNGLDGSDARTNPDSLLSDQTSSTLMGGAVEGAANELGNQATVAALKKAALLMSDKINVKAGLSHLKQLFGFSDNLLGKDAAEAVGQIGPPKLPGADTEIDKVLTNPEIFNHMKSSIVGEGNSLRLLNDKVQTAKNNYGELLNGTKDLAGNPSHVGLVQQIDELPNSGITWNELHAATSQMVDDTVQSMNLADDAGDILAKGTEVRARLQNEMLGYKETRTVEATKAAAQAREKVTLINEGTKDASTGEFIPGLRQIKEQLAPLKKDAAERFLTKEEDALYKSLVKQEADQQTLLNQYVAEELAAKAAAENPTFSFGDINKLKTAIGKLGKFTRIEGVADATEGYSRLYGKLSDFVKAHALAVDEKLGGQFMDASDGYSVHSDFAAMIQKTVGAASRDGGPVRGLTPTIAGTAEVGLETAAAALRPTFRGAGVIRGYTDPTGPMQLNRRFSQSLRKMPDQLDPNQQLRAGVWAERAQQVANSPVARPIFGAVVARSVGGLVGSANAEENLSTIRDGAMLSTLIDGGHIPPNSRQAGFDMAQLPPDLQAQVGQQVMAVLQPLNDAIKFGGEEEVGAAYSQVIKQFPELFPEPKTGIKGEVVDSRGKVKLYDPNDRARYASQLQVNSTISWSEKAKMSSELNSTFTVINPRKLQ